MTTPSTQALARATAFKASVRKATSVSAPCGHTTSPGILAALGSCSHCAAGIPVQR